jgi:carboxyl-terminal processing protease
MIYNVKKIFKKSKVIFISVLVFISSFIFISSDSEDFEIVKNLDIYYTLFREVNMFYVDPIKPGDLIKTSIDAMLESLDPYTTFFPESKIEDFRFMTTGQYGGVGATIRQQGDYIVITELFEGAPSVNAGLKAGDVIIEIDGKSTKGKTTPDISEILKGQPKSIIKLLIRRPGNSALIEKNIERSQINIKSVPYFGMLNKETGYIMLTEFTENSGKDVKDALINLKENYKAKSVIIDLRNNPGGLLVEAVNIANLFVKKDETIVSTKGKVSKWNNVFKSLSNPYDPEMPIVILVNRGSASSSEIIAGAFQDLDRGVIIGQRTFGKGLVQATRDLCYHSKLKITTSKYYIPSGRCIQALDYSHRNEDGSVGKIPDSLITGFKTKNGRKVYDGGGILPDIVTEQERLSNISVSLLTKYLIFDFATQYCISHDSLPQPSIFSITDNDYKNFIDFLADKNFDYITRSESDLKDLIEETQKEKYYSHAKPEFDSLKLKLAHDKNKDLKIFKEEIKDLLTQEIISRYYFQKGRIISLLRVDKDVQKAIDVLNNKELYSSILNGTFKNN